MSAGRRAWIAYSAQELEHVKSNFCEMFGSRKLQEFHEWLGAEQCDHTSTSQQLPLWGTHTMPSSSKVSRQSRHRRLVLCIDDHRQGLHARRLILQSAGYDVLTASSGRAGLRLLGRNPVHLVIVDYAMPEMNGEAVAREIRRTHPDVPIVMLSGQLEIPKRAASAVDAFVAKGQPPAVLLGELTRLSA